MRYEVALKQVNYLAPSNIAEVIKRGEKARGTLKKIGDKIMETTNKRFHAYRRIVEEAELAKEENYKLPVLRDYKTDIESVNALSERYKLAINKISVLADNNFNLDPENISEFEISALVEFVLKMEGTGNTFS